MMDETVVLTDAERWMLRDKALWSQSDRLFGAVESIIAARQADVLREVAAYFEDQVSMFWGGSAHWLTTGSHVAGLVADTLREHADDLRTPTAKGASDD